MEEKLCAVINKTFSGLHILNLMINLYLETKVLLKCKQDHFFFNSVILTHKDICIESS